MITSTGLKLPLPVTWGQPAEPEVHLPDIDLGFETDTTKGLANTAFGAIQELVARAYHGWAHEGEKRKRAQHSIQELAIIGIEVADLLEYLATAKPDLARE